MFRDLGLRSAIRCVKGSENKLFTVGFDSIAMAKTDSSTLVNANIYIYEVNSPRFAVLIVFTIFLTECNII